VYSNEERCYYIVELGSKSEVGHFSTPPDFLR